MMSWATGFFRRRPSLNAGCRQALSRTLLPSNASGVADLHRGRLNEGLGSETKPSGMTNVYTAPKLWTSPAFMDTDSSSCSSYHTRTKTRSPQTNGICERFHKTMLDEFYCIAFRKKLYTTIEALQRDLDAWLGEYNERRPHQGRWCFGKTPMQTF